MKKYSYNKRISFDFLKSAGRLALILGAGGVLSVSVLAGDTLVPGVECVSYNPFPDPQCLSTSDKITIRTEKGAGEDADFENAQRLLIQVKGPNDDGALNTVKIVTQKPLVNNGRSRVERQDGTPVLVESEQAASNLRQKDAIIIIDPASGVPRVEVDASSGAARQDAGNVVIIADQLQTLKLKADGYSGQAGENVKTSLAKKALKEGSSDMHPGVAADYVARREADAMLPLDFDFSDLNNYEASGLVCRNDETAVGSAGSYAYDNALDPGSVPEGIQITAAAREQTKRAFCQRNPEFTATQECEAEKEYSFQAVCRVKPEGRSVRFNKRKEIRWQRAVCASDVNSQVRRKIIRSATIEIAIPGMKSFSGTIQREVRFAESYNVYKLNAKTPAEGGGVHDPKAINASLIWFSPFWKQDAELSSDARINIQPGLQVDNAYTGSAYPTKDTSANPQAQRGVKLAFMPRPVLDDGKINNESLFSFRAPGDVTAVTGKAGNFTVQGCSTIIDTHNGRYPEFSSVGAMKSNEGDNYQRYLEYFLSFDANAIGFNDKDLFDAGKAGSGGIIRLTNCFAYEVMEAIDQATNGYGSWALVDGVGEAELTEVTPVCPPGGGDDCAFPTKTGTIAAQSFCPASFPNQIGSETLIQFESADSCYVDDPRDPPIWLKLKKAREKGSLYGTIANLGDDSLVDLREGGEVDRAIGPSDFSIGEYFSPAWYREGTTNDKVLKSSPLAYASEFKWPESMTQSEISSLTTQNIKNFCLPLPENQDWFESEDLSLQRLTKATASSEFTIQQGSSVAVPTGTIKPVCATGIRLDMFLANVPRPSCSAGTSTKVKMSRWSASNGEDVWKTWSEIDQPIGNALSPLPNYSLRSEFINTRYDDLPSQIFTSKTHAVHPTVSLSSSESFTGQAFPPSYGFTSEVNGVTGRKYPGWLRENDLTNKNGAFITPNTFAPIDGLTLFDRSTKWCNADAFVTVGSSIVPGFGAKGILRDVPKRVLGFNFEDIVQSSPGVFDIQSKEYVGIEIVGTAQDQGFFGFNGSQGSIYQGATGQPFNPTDVGKIHQLLTKEAFKASNYPYIGSKFAETCLSGKKYNEFTGFCHDPLTPWKSSSRTVERILHDGQTKEPWAFVLDTDKLTDPTGRLDVAFRPTTDGIAFPDGDGINPLVNPYDYFRLGFLRPMRLWADDREVPKSILLNRPESLGKRVLGTGYATTRDGEVCNQQFRMLAVPVPTRQVPVIKNGRDISVEVDTNNYLSGVSEGGKLWGPIFIAIDTLCDNDVLQVAGTIRQMNSDGSMKESETSSAYGFVRVGVDGGSKRLHLTFQTPAGDARLRMTNIFESVAAGMSATTGKETLEIVEISPPQVRNRASEWSALARKKAAKGWQNKIRTEPTLSSSDQNTQPRACLTNNLRNGVWGLVDSTPILNGDLIQNCEDEGATCVLNEEELGLFTKTVANSKALVTTRPGATQFTPWTHELPANAPKSDVYTTTKPFGEWTVIQNGEDQASVPSCAIFDGLSDVPDSYLPRSNFDDVPKVLDEGIVYRIKKPNDENADFIILPENTDARKSLSCLRWDSVTGKSCEVFHPSVGGPETGALIFGGGWRNVFVESKERVSQECGEFTRLQNGQLTASCRNDYMSAADSTAACTQGSSVFSLCRACADDATKLCAPYMQPKSEAFTTECTGTSCLFSTNTQSFQVEAAIPVSGLPGEDGTNSGTATIFCRDCRAIDFSALPGTGGLGSNPVSSERSKTLTCLSWNHNPLSPQFSVRNLWSQPFVGGSSGQNGRPGDIGGDLRIFSDLTPEAIFQLSQEGFWLNTK